VLTLEPSPTSPEREVRLLGMPVALFRKTREQHDDLLREFAVMALGHGELDLSQPEDLRRLIQQLGGPFMRAVARSNDEVDAAALAGKRHLDLSYRWSASLLSVVEYLESLMLRADGFCAQGLMLTMPRSPQVLTLSRWWVGEFRRQDAGEAPLSWAQWSALGGAHAHPRIG
jgi:hypothetical protein